MMMKNPLTRLLMVPALALMLAAPAIAAAEDSPEAALIAAVNGERAGARLRALAVEGRLACAARAHARDLVVSGRFSHTGSDGGDLIARLARAGYVYAMAAENLALAGPAPDEVVRLWRESPGHNRNMRAAEAQAAGAARERAGDGRYLWVIVFGAEKPGIGQKAPISAKCGGKME